MIPTATLAALLLATPLRLDVQSRWDAAPGTTILSFTQRDVGSRRYHTAIALADGGDLVGHVLTRRGRAVCVFTGAIAGGCVTLDGCGFDPRPVCP